MPPQHNDITDDDHDNHNDLGDGSDDHGGI
jgi:hypothetical protein